MIISDHDEDRKLASSALNGDIEAFSRLVRRHQDAVYNLAYRLCGNAATAQDIGQEAFIRAYRKLAQYKLEYSFRNWVLGICANLCRSQYRWWSRKRRTEEDYAIEMAIQNEPEGQSAAHKSLMYERLEKALRTLPETLRAPIVLKYMENMSIREISDTLGISLSAAKMRLTRGRKQLSRQLGESIDQGDST